jgi:hypothetical protein
VTWKIAILYRFIQYSTSGFALGFASGEMTLGSTRDVADRRLDELFGASSPVRRFVQLRRGAVPEDGQRVRRPAIRTAKELLIGLRERDGNVQRPAITCTLAGGVSLFWHNGVNITVSPDGDTMTIYSPTFLPDPNSQGPTAPPVLPTAPRLIDLAVSTDTVWQHSATILTALRAPYVFDHL